MVVKLVCEKQRKLLLLNYTKANVLTFILLLKHNISVYPSLKEDKSIDMVFLNLHEYLSVRFDPNNNITDINLSFITGTCKKLLKGYGRQYLN